MIAATHWETWTIGRFSWAWRDAIRMHTTVKRSRWSVSYHIHSTMSSFRTIMILRCSRWESFHSIEWNYSNFVCLSYFLSLSNPIPACDTCRLSRSFAADLFAAEGHEGAAAVHELHCYRLGQEGGQELWVCWCAAKLTENRRKLFLVKYVSETNSKRFHFHTQKKLIEFPSQQFPNRVHLSKPHIFSKSNGREKNVLDKCSKRESGAISKLFFIPFYFHVTNRNVVFLFVDIVGNFIFSSLSTSPSSLLVFSHYLTFAGSYLVLWFDKESKKEKMKNQFKFHSEKKIFSGTFPSSPFLSFSLMRIEKFLLVHFSIIFFSTLYCCEWVGDFNSLV